MLSRITLASTLALLAGTTFAQQGAGVFSHRPGGGVYSYADAQQSGGVFSHTDHAAAGAEQSGGESTFLVYASSAKGGTNISYRSGKTVVELRYDDGDLFDLEVLRNGRGVNASAHVEDGMIVVRDDRNEVIASIKAPGRGAADELEEAVAQARPAGGARWTASSDPQRSKANAERRTAETARRARNQSPSTETVRAIRTDVTVQDDGSRRVIGISASAPSPALGAQLGVEPDQVIVIDTVTPGLPAEKAGLKRFDVITRIDGKPPATIERLRDVIRLKGDEPITLDIVRGGKSQEIKIVAVAEPGVGTLVRSGGASGGGANDESTFEFSVADGAWNRLTPAQRETVERAMATLREVFEEQREQIVEARETLGQQLRELQNVAGRHMNEQTLAEVRRSVEEAMKHLDHPAFSEHIARAMEEVHRAAESGRMHLRALPEIQFLERGQNGRGLVVAPPPVPPAPAAAPAPSLRVSNAENERLKALEERMARIERLLERIAEER